MTKKQVGINMLANIFSFMVSFGINFFFTPFLIKNVGIEAYSFMPMTGKMCIRDSISTQTSQICNK